MTKRFVVFTFSLGLSFCAYATVEFQGLISHGDAVFAWVGGDRSRVYCISESTDKVLWEAEIQAEDGYRIEALASDDDSRVFFQTSKDSLAIIDIRSGKVVDTPKIKGFGVGSGVASKAGIIARPAVLDVGPLSDKESRVSCFSLSEGKRLWSRSVSNSSSVSQFGLKLCGDIVLLCALLEDDSEQRQWGADAWIMTCLSAKDGEMLFSDEGEFAPSPSESMPLLNYEVHQVEGYVLAMLNGTIWVLERDAGLRLIAKKETHTALQNPRVLAGAGQVLAMSFDREEREESVSSFSMPGLVERRKWKVAGRTTTALALGTKMYLLNEGKELDGRIRALITIDILTGSQGGMELSEATGKALSSWPRFVEKPHVLTASGKCFFLSLQSQRKGASAQVLGSLSLETGETKPLLVLTNDAVTDLTRDVENPNPSKDNPTIEMQDSDKDKGNKGGE